MAAPYQYRACMQACMASLNAFLSHFTSPALASSLHPLPARSLSPAFTAWLASPAHLDATIPESAEKRATLELAMKRRLDEAMRAEAGGTGLASGESVVALLLDAALWCKAHRYLDPVAHLGLIEDLLESQTIETAEMVFTQVLNPRIDLFIKASDSQRARLLFFRLCNNLLRRLSKTTNTFFAGQISMKISYICPVDERSAVNPSGRFNKENVTLAVDPPPVVREEGEAEEEPPAPGSSVYERLWALQGFFADPLALKTPAVLEAFHASADVTLAQFERVSLGEKEAVAAIVSSNGLGVGAAAEPSVFPKYLTGGRLLELQLKDAVFRREVALQLLIFLAHVLNPSGNVEVMKEIMATQPAGVLSGTGAATAAPATANSTSAAPPSASATTTQQLAQTNLSGAFLPVAALPPLRTLFSRALKLYKSTPPFAFQFSEAFQTWLAREQKFWVGWKEAKCPPIERKPLDREELARSLQVEEVAKALRDKRAGVTAGPQGQDDAASKKRKLDTMAGTGGGGGFRAKPSFGGFGSSAASLKVHGRWLMGTEGLAKLWDPSLDMNASNAEFLQSEDRAFQPSLERWIQTLLDEEAEWRRVSELRRARKEERAAARKQAAAVKKEEPKVKAEGQEGEDQPMEDTEQAPTEDGGDGEGDDDDEDDGELRLQDMFKSDARKQWQFLRLCILTPAVPAIWLREGEDDDREVPLVPGLELFLKSEGSLQKLVEVWMAERRKGQGKTDDAEGMNVAASPTTEPDASPVADSPLATTDTPTAGDRESPAPLLDLTPAGSPVPAASPTGDAGAADATEQTGGEAGDTAADEPPTKRQKTSQDSTPAPSPVPAAEPMDTQ